MCGSDWLNYDLLGMSYVAVWNSNCPLLSCAEFLARIGFFNSGNWGSDLWNVVGNGNPVGVRASCEVI